MPSLEIQLEAVLFAAGKSIHLKRLAEWCEVSIEQVRDALEHLVRDTRNRGSHVLVHGNEAEIVTNADCSGIVRRALKEDASGELTRPSLEALAILAYRGPMTRPELEQIRGVQSTLILRNLLLRGLVEMKEETRVGQPLYSVTLDFLKHLGLSDLASLPDYASLHGHAAVEQVLNELDSPTIIVDASEKKLDI